MYEIVSRLMELETAIGFDKNDIANAKRNLMAHTDEFKTLSTHLKDKSHLSVAMDMAKNMPENLSEEDAENTFAYVQIILSKLNKKSKSN